MSHFAFCYFHGVDVATSAELNPYMTDNLWHMTMRQ